MEKEKIKKIIKSFRNNWENKGILDWEKLEKELLNE